jgi:hypothetical protein
MNLRIAAAALELSLASWILAPSSASAIPAFARKYQTSCLTCHSVYPRLNPFGEAFRRNGYLFPGVDSDYVKQETVPLGQEANKKTFPKSVWPANLPGSVPIAIGANGQAFVYPDKGASVPRANNGTQFSLDDLVAEGHLWAGAALDDSLTIWAEFTIAHGGADVEHAQVLLNDLLGPKHAVNLVVGRGFPTLTSFGPHSSYLGDVRITNAPVTGIYGLSTDPFILVDNFNGFELTGVLLKGRADYSAGWTTGKNTVGTKFNSENVYGHVGYKFGGLRLDGEGTQGPADAMRPWAENAVTLDAFVYHSREYFPTPGVASPPPLGDTSFTVGAAARLQAGSVELDLGGYGQKHDRGTATLVSVKADAEWAELSWVVFPWMVPAVRFERIALNASDVTGTVADYHVMPGIAFLLRPNIKAVLVGNIEATNGFPQDSTGAPIAYAGGNADWGNFVAAPRPTSTPTSHLSEFESIALYIAWAL